MRARRSISGAAIALLVTQFVVACGSTRSSDGLPREPAARERAIGERLRQLDPSFGRDGEARFLEVTLENAGGDRVTARCAPEWRDAAGTVVAAPKDWKEVDLDAGASQRLRFAPMPPTVRSYVLRFDA